MYAPSAAKLNRSCLIATCAQTTHIVPGVECMMKIIVFGYIVVHSLDQYVKLFRIISLRSMPALTGCYLEHGTFPQPLGAIEYHLLSPSATL